MVILQWLPAALWAALIVYLSHQSQPPGWQIVNRVPDAIRHGGEFLVLGWTIVWGGTGQLRRKLTVPLILGMACAAALFAASDEWHQSFIPGRAPEFTDWLADIGGIALALAAAWMWQNRQGGRGA